MVANDVNKRRREETWRENVEERREKDTTAIQGRVDERS
jgi:hypothetical protein